MIFKGGFRILNYMTNKTPEMDELKNVTKVLKWVGIVALALVPVVLVFKKLIAKRASQDGDDGSDIFAEELLP